MFLDFHTHRISAAPGARFIFNVILKGDDGDETWKNLDAVSVGIHPWHIPDDDTVFEVLRKVAGLPVVKCIGEAGLDRLRGGAIERQAAVFERQIRIAEEVNKPVVVHCVRAYNELLALCKKIRPRVPLIVHGFNRKPELAQRLVSAGFYLSFGREILTREHVQQSFVRVPPGRVFLETDGHEFIEIEQIYTKAAALRGVSLDKLREEIDQNYITL